MPPKGTKVLNFNRKARFEYEIDDVIECGIVLVGTEVKSIKAHHFNFADAYARVRDGELWLIGLHVSPYSHGNINNHSAERDRKLLVHSAEINRLRRRSEEKGLTLVPLSLYLSNGRVKVELGICRGKKLHDKRQAIRDRDLDREAQRELRRTN